VLNAFIQVFSKIRYTAIAITISAIVFVFAAWLPNIKLIIEIIFNSGASVLEKMGILYSLLGSIQTNFSVVSAGYTIAIAILFGINITLLIFYIRSRREVKLGSGATLSAGGLISGIFGIGCATCGTFILSSLLGIFGAAGILAFLPFGGGELGLLGIGLLLYSSYILLNRISGPLVCEL